MSRSLSEDPKPTILDLFCGAGGLSEGFKQAGFRIVSGIDSDYYSIQTFVRNHIGALGICKDIQKITLRDIHKTLNGITFDGIIGSPPCQGFTTIAMPKLRSLGVSRTTEIPRNGLYRQFVRLVKLLRPKFFVMENVKGMLTIENGKIPNDIISKLQRYYSIDILCKDAVDYGVPQHRKRIFIIGNRIGVANPDPRPIYYASNNRPKRFDSLPPSIGDFVVTDELILYCMK